MLVLYSNMWKMLFILVIPFSASYPVELVFSRVNHFVAKEGNLLKISKRESHVLFLTKSESDIQYLVLQPQPQGVSLIIYLI